MPEEQVEAVPDALGSGPPDDHRHPDSERGPVDPDVDLGQPRQRGEWSAHRWMLPTIGLGGMVGASARHGLEVAWPVAPGGFPWATFVTNVSGCALIGLLMVYVVELGAGHPLLRPFLGVGVLGGFTTFSTYTVQTTDLMDAREPLLALVYLFGTVVVALLAVAIGVFSGRSALVLLRRMHGRDLDLADR
jgi:CrcB protein